MAAAGRGIGLLLQKQHRPNRTTNSEGHWIEDVATVVVLGALAATSLTISTWLFRGLAESLVFSNGPDLMRGFMGM